MTLQSFFFLSYLMDALATAANGLVADGLGRKDVQRARTVAERCVTFGGGIAAVLALVLGLAPGGVAGIFTDGQCALNLFSYTAVLVRRTCTCCSARVCCRCFRLHEEWLP